MLLGRRLASPEELVERLCNDQVRRWRAGQRVPAEAYFGLYPTIRADSEAAFELIYGEFLLREELGEPPQWEEFRWRFPRFAERLRRQLDLHAVLREDEPVAEGPDAEPTMPEAAPWAGSRWLVPGYRVMGELGRGGMGTVYKAWQVRLKRVVALKVIRTDAYADPGAAARFQAEAEAAARLQHPNLVPVFEIGEHEGMGYLVLEYVAGGGLDRRLAGALQDPRDAARLLETLARAIHSAHQQGIIHRDLKPANVLLTTDGIPKITDFGLAKLVERSEGLTQTGEILGTPSYMAPEQVRGLSDQITAATDVYSLGAILYESLTGRPPFKGTTPLSTLEQVSSQEPLSPSKLQRHLPRDLETICLKSLEKEPQRRYPTALALAEDLRRFLRGEPILARPTPAWERAWKWVQRRPWAAAALSLVVFLLLLLLGGAGYYNARLRDQTHVAQLNAGKAIEQRNLALKVLDQLVYEVQKKLAPTPATRSLRRGLLDTAIAGLDEIGRSTMGSPPDLSQAVAHQKLADIFRIIGETAAARWHYQRSRSLAEDLLAAAPAAPAIEQVLYQTHMGLGLLDVAARQYDQAKADFGRAVATAESIAAAWPGPEQARRDLIEAYLQLGRAHSFAYLELDRAPREFAAAEEWFRKMQQLAGRWVAETPGNHPARDLLSSSYRKLGDLRKFARDFAAARHDYSQAIAIGKELLAAEPGNFEFKTHLATALDDLAGVSWSQGRLDEARQLFGEAEQLFGALVATDPERLESRLSFLHTQWNRATFERDQAQFAAAAGWFRRIRDQVLPLQRAGRLEERAFPFADARALESEILICQAAPAALQDLESARSQPSSVAARLCLLHARASSAAHAPSRVAAAAELLRTLEAQDPEDRLDLARALAQLVWDLDSGRCPELAAGDRLGLRNRCADWAVEHLRRAVAGGLRELDRLEGGEFRALSQHPGYRTLVAQRSRRPDPTDRLTTPE
ncbi:MAG TPA: protein kinase [Isosphaeraceae bacterium]|nr:protein kinase [Isosphaeraceae bacterium]